MAATDYFDTLADGDFVMSVGVVFAAFFLPTVVSGAVSTVSQSTAQKIPQETYGVGVIVAAEAFLDDYRREAQLGGGVYTADKLAERAELKSTVQEAM